jgi:hypothetical protein
LPAKQLVPTKLNAGETARAPHQCVLLHGGSRIVGEVIASKGIRVVSANVISSDIPLSLVRAVLIHPPAHPRQCSNLLSQLDEDDLRDRVWLNDGQVLTGILELGMTGGAWDLRLKTENANEIIRLPAVRIQAFALSSALFERLEPLASGLTIGTRNGSLLQVEAANVGDAGSTLKLRSGIEIRLSQANDHGDSTICFAQRLASSKQPLTLLGDVAPASYRQSGQSLLRWELGRNKNCNGQPLSVHGGIVPKGIALHAASRVVYKLQPGAASFLATVSIVESEDQQEVRRPAAEIEILVARNGKLERVQTVALDSGTLSEAVDCNITDAQLLVIVAREASSPGTSRGEYAAHVQLLNARIVSRVAVAGELEPASEQ